MMMPLVRASGAQVTLTTVLAVALLAFSLVAWVVLGGLAVLN